MNKMESPLGITFFKKVEIYQEIKQLDNKAASEDEKAGGTPSLWPIGKKILLWTFRGHKHPSSPLSEKLLYSWYKKNKLADLEICPQELYIHGTPSNEINRVTKITVNQVFKHLVFMGLANPSSPSRNNGSKADDKFTITITREGFLTGEVVNESENGNPFVQFSYWLWGYLWGHLGALLFLITLFLKPVLDFGSNVLIWLATNEVDLKVFFQLVGICIIFFYTVFAPEAFFYKGAKKAPLFGRWREMSFPWNLHQSFMHFIGSTIGVLAFYILIFHLGITTPNDYTLTHLILFIIGAMGIMGFIPKILFRSKLESPKVGG